ncbi:MAG: cytochrome b/b6 domain-containing protein [Oligoflexales bacterium]|nr:cytochrome b/b6 domain-containing protein [Oligoflexales bacterium]
MQKKLIYDLPTRMFHWMFAGLFLTAILIAKNIDDDANEFSYHMLAGLTLSFLVLLRVVWGFVGTRHARFTDFALKPRDFFAYFKGILSGDKRRWAGHNPASSWAAIIMMALALGQGLTGYLMATGQDMETWEDIHELLANAFIIVAIGHIAGIVLHTVRHKEMIGLSMINGKKENISQGEAIVTAKSSIGLLLVALVAGYAFYLFSNFDESSRTLNIFGTTLQLGENENENTGENENENTGENENEHSAED